MPVRILEEHVVNKIAAGEVVERPASVLRELLQNSLDAGATSIRVALRNGGMGLIRVADDGTGMNRTDAMMSLERHATSKIHRAEDLESVGTLGFRGEAIPSIAAVSRFEMRTRPHDEDIGTRIRIEGGTLRDVSEVGCAPGTEIDVRSLFFNLPPRRKFLRTRTTELNHCTAAVIREVLARPDLDIEVRHEDRELLRAPRAGSLAERVAAILGDDARPLMQTEGTHSGVRIVGLTSPIGVHRASAAKSVYLYVNGRYVTDRLLRRAVYEAYRGRIPMGRYPLVILDVQLPGTEVDVNVHPTKTEVRFHNPRSVGAAVEQVLRDAVDTAGARPIRRDPSIGSVAPGPLFASEPLPLAAPSNAPAPRPVPVAPSKPPAHPDDDPRIPREPQTGPLMVAEPDVHATALRFRDLQILGGAGNRWVVCNNGPHLWVIDAVAARERLYAQGLMAGEAALGPSQRLLAPTRIAVAPEEAEQLEQISDQLTTLGVDIDRFGPGEVAIRGIPGPLAATDPRTLISALALAARKRGSAIVDTVAQLAARGMAAPEDLHERRTLLATLDEAGIAVDAPVAGRITAGELERRIRGRR